MNNWLTTLFLNNWVPTLLVLVGSLIYDVLKLEGQVHKLEEQLKRGGTTHEE